MRIEKPRKGAFWKSLAKAIIPGFILKKSVEKVVPGPDKGSLLFIGAGMAVVPGAVELATTGKGSEGASVGIEAYESTGLLLASKSVLSTKNARKDWEELRVGYKVTQDRTINLRTYYSTWMSCGNCPNP